MLDDDRIPPVVPWFRELIAGFPEPMAGELNTWFELMLAGSTTAPRVKARSPRWIRRMVNTALPVGGLEPLRLQLRGRTQMLQVVRHLLAPVHRQAALCRLPLPAGRTRPGPAATPGSPGVGSRAVRSASWSPRSSRSGLFGPVGRAAAVMYFRWKPGTG